MLPSAELSVIFMKFKCSECQSIFNHKTGESYDWRRNKIWCFSCPECNAELGSVNDQIELNTRTITLFTLYFLFILSAFLWFIFFRHITPYGSEISIALAVLYLFWATVSWYKHRNDPEEILRTYPIK